MRRWWKVHRPARVGKQRRRQAGHMAAVKERPKSEDPPFQCYKGIPSFPSILTRDCPSSLLTRDSAGRPDAGRARRSATAEARSGSNPMPGSAARLPKQARWNKGNAGPPGARACAGTRRRGRGGPTPLEVLERRRCERRPWPLAWPLPVMNLSSRCEAPAWMAAFRAAASPPTASQAGVMVCSLRRRPASASARQWHAAKRAQARAPDIRTRTTPIYIYKGLS